ncbi:MAG: hypothetical protein M3O72_02460, partial [Verrucomicrobiota bacterium]|nr:hypothetical protein [Verrucomicrobiota bacterium]
MSQTAIENKVKEYLRNSQLLEQYWQKPITPEQLQAEMDRMARHTKQPDVLREVFAALGNDPGVIAECVARPALAERLIETLYAHDSRFHGELKRRAEAELEATHAIAQMKKTSANYTEVDWIKTDVGDDRSVEDKHDNAAVRMNESEWKESAAKLAGAFRSASTEEGGAFGGRARVAEADPFGRVTESTHTAGAAGSYEAIPIGQLSGLHEDNSSYYATTVISKGKGRLKIATIAWIKLPLDEWRATAAVSLPVAMSATVPASYQLPSIAQNCSDDTWTPTFSGVPDARYLHTAVWTGTEMIVWGGYGSGYLNTGGRYNPTTDT